MKNTPLIIGIIVILLLGVAGYFFMQNRDATSMIGSNEKKMVSNEQSGMMTLKELMALGKSQMCTFSYSGPNGTTEGTSYIANNNVRTDFKGTDPNGKSYEGGMIMDGSYAYSWTTETKQGIKMPITETMEQEIDKAQQQKDIYNPQYVDADAKTDYKCSNWNTDSSKFTPPSDITFMDMSEQMKVYDEMMQQNTNNPDMQSACSACDSLTGDAMTACKKALKCG